MFRSLTQPPRVSKSGVERFLPKSLLRAGYWMADRFLDSLALKHINPLRQRIGLPPVRRIMKDWWMSPDLVIALFPDWFCVPKNELPSQVQTVGFPLTDSAQLVSDEVNKQLHRVSQQLGDQRPVVFAPGSANFQAAAFLETAKAACERLNLPAVLLSPNPNDTPKGPTKAHCCGRIPPVLQATAARASRCASWRCRHNQPMFSSRCCSARYADGF